MSMREHQRYCPECDRDLDDYMWKGTPDPDMCVECATGRRCCDGTGSPEGFCVMVKATDYEGSNDPPGSWHKTTEWVCRYCGEPGEPNQWNTEDVA